MSETVQADNGVALPLTDLSSTLTWSGDFILTYTVVYRGLTYVQTFTNNGSQITSISPFEVQS